MSSENPSCFFIGADALLIECVRIAKELSFDIRGIFTDSPRISHWARRHAIPLYNTRSDLLPTLQANEFEYLFAITHLRLLSPEVIAAPSKLCINFHDGPLPKYAGLNAPVWALLNGEREYGISFHEVTPGVDEGEILAQEHFSLEADETALSLNTRCFATAMKLFRSLCSDIRADVLKRTPQDLTQRSCFFRYDTPPDLATLRPDATVAATLRLAAALDHGDYPNPVAIPKIRCGAKALLALGIEAESETGQTAGAPGQLSSLSCGALRLQLSDGAIHIRQPASLLGEPLSAEAALEHLGLASGDCLPSPPSLPDELRRGAAKADHRFREALLALTDVNLGATLLSDPQSPAWKPATRLSEGAISLPDIAAAVAVACYKRTGEHAFHFSLRVPPDDASDLSPLTSPCRPLALHVHPGDTLSALRDRVAADIHRTQEGPSFLLDLWPRIPAAARRPTDPGSLPLSIELRADPTDDAPTTAALAVAASAEGASFALHPGRMRSSEGGLLIRQVEHILARLREAPTARVDAIDLLTQEERGQLERLGHVGQSTRSGPATVVEQFAVSAAEHAEKTALVDGQARLSYGDLAARVSRLAARLAAAGVQRESLVGVCVRRSNPMVEAALAIMQAGGAYVPMDPAYPTDRLRFMSEDAKLSFIISDQPLAFSFAGTEIRLDGDSVPGSETATPPGLPPPQPEDRAYVIYTSGSTGTPKGVEVEHRNLSNFFAAMDATVPRTENDAWLAVTSLSFDISILELFWTLCRGFKVTLYQPQRADGVRKPPTKPMDFGLFYWGNDDGPGERKYRLLLEGARFADANGFQSVWTPERHFHAFGGPYPNPAVTGAAVAAITKNVSIRSGSCVLPLHHPVRVAEEWAVLDNLSGGRAALAFAAGWQPDDFLLQPQNHADNKAKMYAYIDIVRRLWRGDSVEFPGPRGPVSVVTQPRPVQKELPFWVTTAGNPDTYREAGETGGHILTHLLGQSFDEIATKVDAYRSALSEHHPGVDGKVTLMLHTFCGTNDDVVRDIVREPLKDYLRSSVRLVKSYAWDFPAFKRPTDGAAAPDVDLGQLTDDELDAILEHAFLRYFNESGLFGSLDACLDAVDRARAAGVDEIACLIDFGVDSDQVLKMLPALAQVRAAAQPGTAEGAQEREFWEVVAREGITHIQCTPSMAKMLMLDERNRAALLSIPHVLFGGEALTPELAESFARRPSGTLLNMYGPTETTIWSSVQPITADSPEPVLGPPVANTQFYVLDRDLCLAPKGTPGELCIGGAGVVRGYLLRPELTGARFVHANLFGETVRIYRTGDLVRWNDDGTLQFLGRIDHQIKLRGHRIELGEIEAALRAECVGAEPLVMVREDSHGDQQLVAYLETDDAVDAELLRDRLRARLPDYMVPTHFVALREFPLTPNAKIDRSQLPAPSAGSSAPATEYSAPTGAMEKTIASIWSETLGRDQIGLDDNFFDIGGHSLLVVRAHQALKDALERPVAITDLYRFPTIRALAGHFEGDGSSSDQISSGIDRANKRKAMSQRRRGRAST